MINLEIITLHLHKSSIVTFGRNGCTAGFLSSDCTHMLFVDTDISFSAYDVLRLIDADKDVTVGVYSKKYINNQKVENLLQNANFMQ